MTDYTDLAHSDRHFLLQEATYSNRLMAHPDCLDPEHPGCPDCEDDDDTEPEDGNYCSVCDGSGEGPHDGTRCGVCRGSGMQPPAYHD